MHNALFGIRIEDILIRFFLGGFTVALSAAIGRMAGGRIGGIFAAFPAVYLSAVITAAMGPDAEGAADRVMQVSKGALIGMIANIACAICASIFIRRIGLGKGMLSSLGVWLVFSCAVFFISLHFGLIK